MAKENAPGPQPMIDLLTPARRQALTTIFGDKFANTFMGPIAFIDDGKLSSPTAINFFKRDFPYISKVLNYEYQYRSWNGFDQALLDRYSEMITKKLTSIALLLENRINQISNLLESNGHKMESAVYSNALEISVPIISGHARGYYLALQELDRLNLIAGTANLLGVINSTQRAEAEFMCKKAVRAFSAALRNEVVRLYREADRLMRAQHGEGAADEAQTATVAAQGKVLDDFGKAMEEDGQKDRSLNLDGADPNKVIDDAAAASKVTAPKSATKKKVADAATETAAAPAPAAA